MINPKQLIHSLLKRHRESLPLSWQRKYGKCVTLKPKGVRPRGRVLVSYALTSAGLPECHPLFEYHTGPWESNRIISLFLGLGFIVDCIHYTNSHFVPEKKYDIIFSCTGELLRLAAYAPEGEKAVKIWHSVVSLISYNNGREMERIVQLEARKPDALYFPKRQEPYERLEKKLMETADYCVLIGNEHVQNTFPKEFQKKITRITVSSSLLRQSKTEENFVPPEREFLWHFGSGAVRKGLDLLLEVFARNPQWMLHIVGAVQGEPDFMRIYRRELNGLPNIHLHGYLKPGSREFFEITKRCFCFLAPTATESISTAVTTLMQAGLYPLVSRDSGIDLPKDAGRYFEHCTLDEIEQIIDEVHALPSAELSRQIKKTRDLALAEYSREKFTEGMKTFLERVVREKNL